MSRKKYEQLIQDFYHKLWNRFDKSQIDLLLTEDFRFRGSLGQYKTGRRQFADYIDFIELAFPDFRNQIDEVLIDGDRACARLTFRGTHRGVLFGFQPTGKPIEFDGVAFFRFRQNQIAEVWVLGDIHGLLGQLED